MSVNRPANQPANQANFNSPSGPGNSGGSRHPDPADLTLYAMQLLTDEVVATIAQHLENCAECRAELARINGDLAACAIAVDLELPPAAARERLLKQVAREKKVIPIAPPATPVAAFGRSGSVLELETRPEKPPASRPILAWSGWAVAAALAVAVALLSRNHRVLSETLASQNSRIQRLTAGAASAHRLLDALTDPQAVRVTLTPKAQLRRGPIGGVTYNPGKGTLVFLASNLDPLRRYKTYELWVIPSDGSRPIPAGTFHPDDHGSASVIIPDLPRNVPAKAFGVTIEDDGGSQTPTLPIILAGT
jgi:hypothetical protein